MHRNEYMLKTKLILEVSFVEKKVIRKSISDIAVYLFKWQLKITYDRTKIHFSPLDQTMRLEES